MSRDRRLSAAERRVARLRVPKTVEDQFGRYAEDPVGFCRDVLGVASATRRSTGEPYQFSVLADLARHQRVTVRAGHGVGKTGIDAWAVPWWLLTRPGSRVVVVAPEFQRQIRSILFSEIRRWVRRAKVPLPLEVRASRVLVQGHGEEWSAIGLPATEPDRIEGFHSEAGVLLILDETKGIPKDVYDALQGVLTGTADNRLLVTSVPGGAQGPFYTVWAHGGAAWKRHHIPSTDSTLVDPQWVEDRRQEWGEASPLFQTRVLGQFATAGEGVLFPLHLLEAAQGRALEASGRVTLGVDVARSVAGDRNVIAVTQGPKVVGIVSWHSADTMQVVSRVLHEATERDPARIRVDVGGVGAGCVDRLRQLGQPVEAVTFGGQARDPRRFANRRAELFWTLREALDKGELALPKDDDDLMADLAVLRYAFDAKGRIVLEAKDEIRRKLGRSPDRGDALALAVSATREAGVPVNAEAVLAANATLWAPSKWSESGGGPRHKQSVYGSFQVRRS